MNGKVAIPCVLVGGLALSIFYYGGLNNKVDTNVKDITEIKEDTKKIPAIETKIEYIMTEQRVMKEDVKEILRAVQ